MAQQSPLVSVSPEGFDASGFSSFCGQNASAYQTAEPFPSICIDNLLPQDYLRTILGEFPSLEEMNVERGGKAVHVKGHISDINRLGPRTRELINWLNSPAFLLPLEELTGIKGLIPDPYLFGGGLHNTASGGFLKVHADFNYHPRFKLNRRLNVLVYLNEQWEQSWGGQIELWSRDMTRKVRSFDPILGRMVLFSTDADSFHGHPDPMQLPDGLTRKSIALYYYTNGESNEARTPADERSTLYRARPGEVLRRVEAKPGKEKKTGAARKPREEAKPSTLRRLFGFIR